MTAMTGHNAYLGSLYKMKSSIKYRSLGAVAEAFQAIPAELPDARTPYESPTCDEHWRVDFGLFKGAERIESMAFARLQRCGDFVIVMHMIGHADILAVGGMKLLQFELMEWLLKRQTPMVTGLRYLLHGPLRTVMQALRQAFTRRRGADRSIDRRNPALRQSGGIAGVVCFHD